MNRPHGSPEWVMDFANAICPESPGLLLSTNEKNILTAATQKIHDLEAELTQLRTERDQLREALRDIEGFCYGLPAESFGQSAYRVAHAALTEREPRGQQIWPPVVDSANDSRQGGDDDHR